MLQFQLNRSFSILPIYHHIRPKFSTSSRSEALTYAQQVGVIQRYSEWLLCKKGPDDATSSFYKRLMREVDDESLSCNLIISKVCDNLNYLQLNHQDNQALARTLSQRIIENDDENPTLLSTSDPSHKSVLNLINKNPVFIFFKNLDNVSRYRVD